MSSGTKRNPAFDLMKGIAIILMVWEHCTIHPLPYEHAFVYSFHMPLFFLLSGFFAKDIFSFDGFWATTKKNAKRLLLPYIITFLLTIVWGLLMAFVKHDWNQVIRPIITLFWFSGDDWMAKSGLITTGPLWFLIALFWGRELFTCIQVVVRKWKWYYEYTDWMILAVCTVLSLFAKLIYPIAHPLPLGILQGLCCLVFYAIGYIVARHNIPWYIYTLCIVCWPLSIFFGKVELMVCTYSFPLDILGACGATYLIYKLYQWIASFRPTSFLSWCGRFSLAIVCMHTFEMASGILWTIKSHVPFDVTPDMMMVARFILPFILSIAVIYIPYLKQIYR